MKIFFMAMMTIFPPCALALPTDNAAIALEGLVAERIDADSREGLATYYAKRLSLIHI